MISDDDDVDRDDVVVAMVVVEKALLLAANSKTKNNNSGNLMILGWMALRVGTKEKMMMCVYVSSRRSHSNNLESTIDTLTVNIMESDHKHEE